MDNRAGKQLHDTLSFVGLRAQATAVGLLAVTAELIRAGVLDEAAVQRIKDAIFADLALGRPTSREKRDYEAMLKKRLDSLFHVDVCAHCGPNKAEQATPSTQH